jgi:aminoglycoside phosphotransferase (APT) family kinase protein
MVDDRRRAVSGWRQKLAADPVLDELFDTTVRRIDELLPHCPERRDLVHGDLLHQNVLVNEDASRVNAVYSWKCSVRGDYLYDVAWCTFWSPWHPGIAVVDLWSRTMASVGDDESLADAALRHHCYELHIGVQHLAWCAWTENHKELLAVAKRTSNVLATGPPADHI